MDQVPASGIDPRRMFSARGWTREMRKLPAHTMPRRASGRGFTLVELLISAAIIGILAAIAVPNLLEAQTNSKVSRAKADLRSLATAAESYYADNAAYPPNNALRPSDPYGLQFNTKAMLAPLSTPVAYIANSHLLDVFGNEARLGGQWVYTYTRLHPEEGLFKFVYPSVGLTADEIARIECHKYYVYSVGPDRLSIYGECLAAAGGNAPTALQDSVRAFVNGEFIYDPTNGTTSRGDIARSALGFVKKAL